MWFGIVEHCSTQVDFIDNLGILDTDSFQDLLACEHRVGTFAVDVEGRDVQARLMAGILRVARADAAR